MINVLEVESSKGWGGQEKRTARLACAMPKEELHTIFAANPDSYLFTRQGELGITVYAVKMRSTWDLIAVWQLFLLILRHDIHIVSTHSGRDSWLGGFAAKLAGAICVRVRHLQTPFNGSLGYRFLADAVVAVSGQVREYLISRKIKPENTRIIHTGVDTQKFIRGDSTIKQELGIPKDAVTIGIVAVLRAAKRHKDLIHAVASLRDRFDIHLIIAGNGAQRKNLESMVENENLSSFIHLTGHRDDTVNILSGLDIFVLPSDMEALGTALLEAQSCELPVIGSNVGGIPECIQDGISGFLFECGNVSQLAQKIALLAADAQLRAQMGKMARKNIVNRFSVEKMAYETLAHYKELLNVK